MDAKETPGQPGATAPGATHAPNPTAPPRWRRPLLLSLAGALAGAVILVLLLPTMATSRFVLSRVEANLGERIGRPVVIGPVDFGWFTPFRMDALTVPPLASEGAAGPMLAVGKVRIPVTLMDVLRGNTRDPGPVSIESLEANIVRFEDGRTNLQIALDGLDASSPPRKPGAPSEPGVPSPLPLHSFSAKSATTAVRFHDAGSGLVAGVEGAVLDVDWKGPGQSAILSLVGGGRVNDARAPIDFVLALGEFTDAAGVPTPQAADATVRILMDGVEPPLLEGGLQQKVGDRVLALRFNADVARLAGFLRGAAPGTDIPPIKGFAQGDLRVSGVGAERSTIALTLGTRSLAVPGQGGSPVVLPDLAAQASARVHGTDKLIEQAALNASITGLTVTAGVSGLPTSGPVHDTSFSLKVDASLEEFTQEAMRIAGIQVPRAPATGTLKLSAGTTQGVAEGAPVQMQVRATWQGGELRTLAPFAEDPPALAAKPLDLSPTNFEVGGLVTFDPVMRVLQSDGLTFTAPSIGGGTVTVNGSLPEDGKPEGVLVANLDVDLGRLKSALGPFAPPTLGTLSGRAATRLQWRASESRPTAIDLGAEVPALTLSIGEPPMAIFRGEPVSFDSTIKLGSGDAALLVESAGLRTPLGNVTAAGKLVEGEGAVVDAEWSVDLSRTYAVVNAAKPVSGLRDLSGAASGMLSARYTRPQEPTVLVEGTIERGSAVLDSGDRVPLPGRFLLDVTPTLDRPAGPSVRIDRAEAEWDRLARLAAKGSVASEGVALPVMLDGTLELDHAGLLAALPAGARSALPAGFMLDGSSTTTLSARGDAAPTNAAPGSLQLGLRTDASIASMTVPMEGGPLRLARQDVKASIDAELAPAEPRKARFVATWEHHAEGASGPNGLAITKLQTAAHFEGASLGRVNVMPGFSFESAAVDLPSGRLTLPASRAALDLRTEQEFAKVRMEPSRISIGTLLSWTGSGSFDRASGAWSLKGEGRIADLAGASRLIEPRPDLPRPAEFWGSLGISHDLSGVPDPAAAVARKAIPFRGSVSLRGETLAADFHDGRTFGGGKGTLSLTAGDDGLRASGEVTLATLRTAPAPAAPMADVTITLAAETPDLDRIELTRFAAAAGNRGTELNATGTVSGLHALIVRALEDSAAGRPVTLPEGPAGWLGALSLQSRGTAAIDTKAFADPAAGFGLAGKLGLRWSAASRPGGTLALDLDAAAAGIDASSAGAWKVSQTSGTLGLAKSWRLGRAGFRAPDPPLRPWTIRGIEFDNGTASLHIRDLALRTRAADNGIVIEARTPYMNGGPAAFDGTIALVGGEPVLEGSLQSTGLDLRTILASAKGSPVPLQLDAVSRVKWNLGRTVETGNVLEGLEVTTAIPRIDLATILAVLRFVQPFIGTASALGSEAALRTGVPTDGAMKLRNGTFSFEVRVQVPLLPMPVSVPLVRDTSLSNAVKTSDFSAALERIAGARTALRALLAETLDEALRADTPPGGRPR